MSINERSRSEKALENLLKQNNVTIVELISIPTFRSKLKSSTKILSDYLLKDITINEICDWLLTDEFCELPSYRPTAQNIFRIFKDSPESLQTSFSQNEKLIYRLSEFAKSQKEQNLLNCAFFEQMTDFFSLITRGSFLSNFKRLPYLLAKRIEIISIRHLFYSLATNFTNMFSFTFQVVLFILHNLNDRNKEQVMLLFSRLVKNSSSFSAFDHSKVILALLEIAKTTEHNELVFTQAFQIVENISKNTSNPENVQELLQQFSEDFDITTRPINYGTAIALRLFKTFNPSFVISMVTNPTHMFMHAGILMSIEQASDDILIPFIEENNIPVKLMWAMNVAKSNGYLTKLAILLDSKKDLSESLQTPEWTKFSNEQLKNRIELLNAPPPSNLPKKKKGKPNPKQLAKLNNIILKNKNNSNEKTQENQEDQPNKAKSKDTQQKKSSNKNQNNKKEEKDSSKTTNIKIEKEKDKDKKKPKEKDEEKTQQKEKTTPTKQKPPPPPPKTIDSSTSSDNEESKINSLEIPLPLDVSENSSQNSNNSPSSPSSPSRQRRPSPIPIYTTKDSFENNPEFQEIMHNLSKCRFLHKQIIAEEIMNKRKKSAQSEPSSSSDKTDDEVEIDLNENIINSKSDDNDQKTRHRSSSLRVTSISPPSSRKGLNVPPSRSNSQPNSMSPPSLRSSILAAKVSSSSESESESKKNEKERSKKQQKQQQQTEKGENLKNNEKNRSKNKAKNDPGMKSKSKGEGAESGEKLRKKSDNSDSGERLKVKSENSDSSEKIKTKSENSDSNEKLKKKSENNDSNEKIKLRSENSDSNEKLKKKSENSDSSEKLKTKSENSDSNDKLKIKSEKNDSNEKLKKKSDENDSNEKLKTKSENSDSNEKLKKKSESSDSNEKLKTKSENNDSNEKIKLRSENNDSNEKLKKKSENSDSNEKLKIKTENDDSNKKSKSKEKSKSESDSKNNSKTKTDLDPKTEKKPKSKSKPDSDNKTKSTDKKITKNTNSSQPPRETTDEITIEIDTDSEDDKKKEESFEEDECEVVTVQDSTDNITEIYRKSEEEDVEVVELAEDVTTIGSDIPFSRSIDDLPTNLIEIIPPTPPSSKTNSCTKQNNEEEEENKKENENNDKKNKNKKENEIKNKTKNNKNKKDENNENKNKKDENNENENNKDDVNIDDDNEQEKPALIFTQDDQIIVIDGIMNNEVNDNLNSSKNNDIQRDNSIDDHIRLNSNSNNKSNPNSPSPSSSSDILSSSDLRPAISKEDESTSKLVEEIMKDDEYYMNLSSSSPYTSPLPSPLTSPLPSSSPSKTNIKEENDEIEKEDEINEKSNRQMLFIDLQDDNFVYSSDSEDDEIDGKIAVFEFMSSPSEKIEPIEARHIILTPFGPLLKGEEGQSDAEMESSGSSDDEFTFEFSETPQKILRKKTFELSARFAVISNERPSNSQTKEAQNLNKTPSLKILPQLS